LICMLRGHGVGVLIDVRSRPRSQREEFDRKNLEPAILAAGLSYCWKGDVLGGIGHIKEETIASLAQWQQDKTACLMCMEADHRKCHRHLKIASRLAGLWVEVIHISTISDTRQGSLFGSR